MVLCRLVWASGASLRFTTDIAHLSFPVDGTAGGSYCAVNRSADAASSGTGDAAPPRPPECFGAWQSSKCTGCTRPTAAGPRRRGVLRRRGGRDLRRSSAPTAPARPPPSNASRDCASPTPGTVRVAGLDPVADHDEVTQLLGAQLQESELQPKLTVREALELYAAFYPDPADWQRARRTARPRRASSTAASRKLSGGQKQRLFIALALIGNPQGRRARRADHRPRPARPPRHLAAHRGGTGQRA